MCSTNQYLSVYSLNLDLVLWLETICLSILLQGDAIQFGLELKISKFLMPSFDKLYYGHLIWHHSCQYCLLLCCRQVFQFRLNRISVFVKSFNRFYSRWTDVRQSLSLSVQIENMVVEPLPFNEEHVQFFVLEFVQTFLYNLEFIRLDNLVLSTKSCLASRCYNLVLLFIRTDQSIVNILHHILFTQNYTKTYDKSLRNLIKDV